MPTAPPCPSGCTDPCLDWHDWEKCADCHAPFHYWRWIEHDIHASKQRLGEQIYICACLFWTGLHDRQLGKRLLLRNPNWSAVCSYYSIVHNLRLFWFLLYGSYPTGHAQLGRGLRERYGAKADWTIDQMTPTRRRLTCASFQGLLRDEFDANMLADKLPLIGAMFEAGRELRNDSNYESLILAHQFFHGGVDVNIPHEMARTARTMSDASHSTVCYVTRIMGLVFRNERLWIGRNSPYSGVDLKNLLWRYVHDKIRGANDGQEPTLLSNWLCDLPEIEQEISNADIETNPANELIDRIEYGVFGGKRTLMQKFRHKTTELQDSIERLTRQTT